MIKSPSCSYRLALIEDVKIKSNKKADKANPAKIRFFKVMPPAMISINTKSHNGMLNIAPHITPRLDIGLALWLITGGILLISILVVVWFVLIGFVLYHQVKLNR